MLRPTLIALVVIIFFSPLVVVSNNSQCSPGDQDCELSSMFGPDASVEEPTSDWDEATATSAVFKASVEPVSLNFFSTTQVQLIPSKVNCVTPEGTMNNVEFCYYAIDLGDPSMNFNVHYNKEYSKSTIHNDMLRHRITEFCARDDNDGIVRSFPAYMTRKTIINGSAVNILSDVWVHCCRFNCKSSLEAMSENTLNPLNFTEREMAVALARSYIKAMPRTAMGVSPVKTVTTETCMTEDFMNAPKLPLVSNCHSFVYAAPNGDTRTYSGRVLFNRIKQSPLGDLFGESIIRRTVHVNKSVFANHDTVCPISFNAAESGFNNSYNTRCLEIATPRGFLRWCCCSINMTQCAPRALERKDALLCAHGTYYHGVQTINPKILTGRLIRPLTADRCHVSYHFRQSEVYVEMSPEYDNSHTEHFSGNCELKSNVELSCPHVLEWANSNAIKVECSCRSSDFCNHDMHYNKAAPLTNYKRRCQRAGAFEHVFYDTLYTKNSTEYGGEDEFFCPVYYDVAKRDVMNLVHAGNMRILENEKQKLHEIFTDTTNCHLIEIELNQNGFSKADKCENKERGYQESDFGVPRLVMICSCSSNAYSRKHGEIGRYCDTELSATMNATFVEKFESHLPKCMEAESQFNVETFNILDHRKNKIELPNPETRYCYQAYMNDSGILKSGALTSENAGLARECAVELKRKSSNVSMMCNHLNDNFMCCCRTDLGSTKPCNEFLIRAELINKTALVDHKSPKNSCGSEYCSRRDMGCYVQRWALAQRGQENGCTSSIDGLVQADSERRYLQACEVAENQRKCTVVPQHNGDPVVMCCCKDGVCPAEKARSAFGLEIKSGK